MASNSNNNNNNIHQHPHVAVWVVGLVVAVVVVVASQMTMTNQTASSSSHLSSLRVRKAWTRQWVQQEASAAHMLCTDGPRLHRALMLPQARRRLYHACWRHHHPPQQQQHQRRHSHSFPQQPLRRTTTKAQALPGQPQLLALVWQHRRLGTGQRRGPSDDDALVWRSVWGIGSFASQPRRVRS